MRTKSGFKTFYLILPEELDKAVFHHQHVKLAIMVSFYKFYVYLETSYIGLMILFWTLQYLLSDFSGNGRDGVRNHNLEVTPIVSPMLWPLRHDMINIII